MAVADESNHTRWKRWEVDVNTVVLAARVYVALRERFFITDVGGNKAEAAAGEVIAAIRRAIVDYMNEASGASTE